MAKETANKAAHESTKKQIDWVEELDALAAEAVAPRPSNDFREGISGDKADALCSSWNGMNNGPITRTS